MRKYLLSAAALISLASAAHADDKTLQLEQKVDSLQHQIDEMNASGSKANVDKSADSAEILKKYLNGDTNLTWNGITVYGTIDMGVSYQNHGAPLNDYFYPGVNELVQKNSTRSVFGITPSGLSQSKIGIKVEEPLTNDLSVVAKLETGFNPQSGDLSDAVKSMQQNNGVALGNQTANADGSRAGQFFNGEAYFGVDSSTYGRFTAGRLDSLLLDNILTYDPMGGSYAFSLIGWAGAANGGGDTQDARLDNAARYFVNVGPVHFIALAALDGYGNNTFGAEQFDIGTTWGGFSVDASYSHVKDAIHLASNPAGTLANNTYMAANVSDNTAAALMAKYAFAKATVYGGYEHITYQDPTHSLFNGASDIGGYLLQVNNRAYAAGSEILQIAWTGAKYAFTPQFSLTGAYYYQWQNDFTGKGLGSCETNGACGGDENVLSLMADYAITKRFDVYGGVMYSHVMGGMEAGFAYNNAVSPMVGARFNF